MLYTIIVYLGRLVEPRPAGEVSVLSITITIINIITIITITAITVITMIIIISSSSRFVDKYY